MKYLITKVKDQHSGLAADQRMLQGQLVNQKIHLRRYYPKSNKAQLEIGIKEKSVEIKI